MKQWKNVALILIVSTFAIFVVVICRQFMHSLKKKNIQYNDIDSDSEGETVHEEQEIELSTNMKEDVEETLGAERVQYDSEESV